MADPPEATAGPVPARHSPLESFASRFAAAGGERTVRLRERPFLAMVDLRIGRIGAAPDQPSDESGGSAEMVARVEKVLGLPLPRRPGSAGDADESVLWMGPGWWLTVGPPGTHETTTAARLRDALAAAAGSAAGPAAGSAFGSVVDVSAQRTALELAGPRARDVLMTGCSIDLHPRAFPAGSCVQTLLARAQVVLHCLQADPETGAATGVTTGATTGTAPAYRILVRASFAAYLAEWLLDALTEHT